MKQLDYVLSNEAEVLHFLKSKYPIYHQSNVFFRDIQYGIQTMLFRRGQSVGYADAEKIARAFVELLEKKQIFQPIDRQTWAINYPEFKKPVSTPPPVAKPAAKPSAGAPPAPGSAPAAKPSLPPMSRPAASGTGLPPMSKPSAAPSAGGLPPISRQPSGAAASKPGGLPPITRQPAGSAAPKPGGLPPLKRTDAPAPVSQPAPVAEAKVFVPQPPAAEGNTSASGPVAAGERKPLPPLRPPAAKK